VITTELLSARDWAAVEAAYLSAEKVPHAILDNFLADQALDQLRQKLLNDHRWHFKHPDSNELYLGAPGRR